MCPKISKEFEIDTCRSKDTDALIEAIENGSSSIDYMDDVGQTLLNWASAFGTQEMVEYLCQKGADVNKGQVKDKFSSRISA